MGEQSALNPCALHLSGLDRHMNIVIGVAAMLIAVLATRPNLTAKQRTEYPMTRLRKCPIALGNGCSWIRGVWGISVDTGVDLKLLRIR